MHHTTDLYPAAYIPAEVPRAKTLQVSTSLCHVSVLSALSGKARRQHKHTGGASGRDGFAGILENWWDNNGDLDAI